MTTLEQAKQNVILQVEKYFIEEKHSKAVDTATGECCYRLSDGRRCAIGCLIDDSAYQEKYEGESANSLFDKNPPLREHLLSKNLYPTDSKDWPAFDVFLGRVQRWHDLTEMNAPIREYVEHFCSKDLTFVKIVEN